MVLKPHAVLVAALALAGCKQSLFDSNVEPDPEAQDAATGQPDAGPTTDADPNRPDADPTPPDAGPSIDADPDQPDAAPPVDAGPPCPSVCRGNAAEDFDTEQGGTTGRWFYLADDRIGGLTQMIYGEWNEAMAWFAGGVAPPQPAIAACALLPGEGEDLCAGVAESLLFAATSAAAGSLDPTLGFLPPARGAYRARFDYRVPDGFEAGPNLTLSLYRNTQQDVLWRSLFVPSTATEIAITDLEVVSGDQLFFTVRPEVAGAPPPVGVNAYLSEKGGEFPAGCGLTLRFDGIADADVPEDCDLVSYTGRRVNMLDEYEDFTPLTVAGPYPGVLGDAVQLAEGEYLRPTGTAMDYAGSFTIQMWVAMEPSWTTMALYVDWESGDGLDEGVNLSLTSGGVFYASALFPVADFVDISFDWPDDGAAWHFVRLVRNAETDTFRVCLDGVLKAGATLPGGLDMSPSTAPFIGRNNIFNPPYFIGAIDDVRVFTRALPCPY